MAESRNYTLYLGACKPFGVQARDDYLFFKFLGPPFKPIGLTR